MGLVSPHSFGHNYWWQLNYAQETAAYAQVSINPETGENTGTHYLIWGLVSSTAGNLGTGIHYLDYIASTKYSGSYPGLSNDQWADVVLTASQGLDRTSDFAKWYQDQLASAIKGGFIDDFNSSCPCK